MQLVLVSALLAANLAAATPSAAQPADLTVFAAASLKTALDAIADRVRRETGKRIAISYAASPALARQIEQGAPADLFLSADRDWMDYLDRRGLVRRETRVDLLANRIVLVAPAARAAPLGLKPGVLAAALGDGRFAIAAIATVPAGKYGKAALEKLGLWREVEHRLAQAENVRAALLFVARGEAPLGLVYATDAVADPRVAIVARIPGDSHPPIVYPVAILTDSKSALAMQFLEGLRDPASTAVFAREGFTPLAAR